MELNQEHLTAYLAHYWHQPVQIKEMRTLGGDLAGEGALKAFTYGKPLLIEVTRAGFAEKVVLRQINRNGFGRERDSDRIAEVWLNYATFNKLPRHVKVMDIVALDGEQQLSSCSQVVDFMLLTNFAPGSPYANDLIRIRDQQTCTDLDIARAETLAAYLADIHAKQHDDPLLWRRRLRDLIGHGEGIMGLTDSYPADFALASADDLRQIEEAANRWRWQLKPLSHRLAQVHGDFHPFNILFEGTTDLHLLDRSRGEWGEPADDVSCLSINYLFFSLQAFTAFQEPFVTLYRAFWQRYLADHPDPELFNVIQPWYAWRALVLASPQWYPHLSDPVRSMLLTFARRVIETERFEWEEIGQYFTA